MDLFALRKSLGLSQAAFAAAMGLPYRTYQDLENGRADIRPVHERAAERASLTIAIEQGNPMLAVASIRREALTLAELIKGA